MKSAISRLVLVRAPAAFKRWSDLPEDVQMKIVDELEPADAASAAAANRQLDRITKNSQQWGRLLVGRGGYGPLPEQPRKAVSDLLVPHGRGAPPTYLARCVYMSGAYLEINNLLPCEVEGLARLKRRQEVADIVGRVIAREKSRHWLTGMTRDGSK